MKRFIGSVVLALAILTGTASANLDLTSPPA
jgi:hypothetical protein